MNSLTLRRTLAGVATACILALIQACGGGAGGGGVADISGSGIVSGPVDGFGSIISNGTRMDVSRATITNDGRTVTQDDLHIGDSVVMTGTLNGDGTGSATAVTTDEFLKGPVTSVDVGNNRFVAMGQTVNVDPRTVFGGVTLATLAAGQLVEVHGTLDANDQVRATRVQLKAAPLSEYEVTGVIDSITPTTFAINGLIVNYASATVRTRGSAPLAAGMYVDVEAVAAPSSGTLTATEVEQEDRVPGIASGRRAEIEGVVSEVTPGASRFVLNGVTVQYGPSTVFEDGSAANIVVNATLEVKGTFDSAGVLQAREIEIEQELDVRISTTVDSVDAAGGTFVMLGKTFRVNAQTQIEDDRDDIRPFRLSDLRAGDYVEVRAYLDGATLVASRLERDDDDTELELRGPVDAPDPSGSPFSILGISIATNGGTQFRDQNDNAISSATFYALVGPGDIVEVDQDNRSLPIVADEVEIEKLVP